MPWQKATSAEGKVYYHNSETGETRWTPPAEGVVSGVVTATSEETPDVDAADLELAAMNAKPSNVMVGIVFVLAVFATGLTIAAAASEDWASLNVMGFATSRTGLAERCISYTSSSSAGFGSPYTIDYVEKEATLSSYFLKEDLTSATATEDNKVKIKFPARWNMCRRYGALPTSKMVLRVLNEPPVDIFEPKKADPAPCSPTPCTEEEDKDKLDYSKGMMDETSTPKGEIIVNLGFLMTFAIISVILHALLTIAAGTVAVIGGLHNCCPTGKCPPILPVVCVGIAGIAAILCIVVQCGLIFLWLVGAGSFFSGALGYSHGLAFYISVMALGIDLVIVAILAKRQEMRFRTCCAGREHCCAEC